MTLDQVRRKFRKNSEKIGYRLAKILIKELEGQGHRATGELIKSVVGVVVEAMNQLDIELQHYKYGIYLNKGTQPAKVPFSGVAWKRKSKKTSRYIQALINWIRLMGFTSGLEKDILGTAFAIAFSHKKYGNPIPYSKLKNKGISKNGRRLGWIDRITSEYKVTLDKEVKAVLDEFVEGVFDSMLIDVTKRNKYLVLQKT